MGLALVVLVMGTLISLAVGPADTQDTTGKEVLGYKYASNADPYVKLIDDICSIRDSLDKSTVPDYVTAQAIYRNGATSTKKLQGFAKASMLNYTEVDKEKYATLYSTYFNSSTFLDDMVEKAFNRTAHSSGPLALNAQATVVLKNTIQYAVVVSFFWHEFDAALKKISQNNLADASGAPHNIDEAFPLWFHTGNSTSCSVFAQAEALSKEFGTRSTCAISKVNAQALQAMNSSLAAARAGDAAKVGANAATMERQVFVLFSQALLKHSKGMEDKLKSNATTSSDLYKDQAAAYSYWRVIAPLLNSKSSASAQTIDGLINPFAVFPPTDTNVHTKVKAALESSYSAMGVSSEDVGTFGAPLNIPPCSAPPAPTSPQGAASSLGQSALLSLAASAAMIALAVLA